MSFHKSVATLVSALTQNPAVALFDLRIGGPLDAAELAQVHERLGFTLDPRFLDYFRQCNGLRLRWIESLGERPSDPSDPSAMAAAFFEHHSQGMNCGSINIPPLCELFPATMDYRFGREDEPSSDASSVPILGGFDEGALRSCLRPLDDYLQSESDSSFYNIALVADPRFPDPVCILTSDYSAALSDSPPMRARAYLDFVVQTCGLPRARLSALRSRGSEGDYPLIEQVPPPAKDPEEFLHYLLDQLPLERSREIAAAFAAISG